MVQLSRRQKMWLIAGATCCALFIVFTLVVAFVDVDQVGLSHLNQFFWQHCGKNVVWERITDWLGYLTILAVLSLIALQIVQFVRRKSLARVDRNLLVMDVVLAVMVGVYALFEFVVVNCRPELVNGVAKASYPSSHAMLFTTVLPLLIWQLWFYLKRRPWQIVLTVLMSVLLVLGIVGRLLSGVHWFTDILAGIIIGCGLACLYVGLTVCEYRQ